MDGWTGLLTIPHDAISLTSQGASAEAIAVNLTVKVLSFIVRHSVMTSVRAGPLASALPPHATLPSLGRALILALYQHIVTT